MTRLIIIFTIVLVCRLHGQTGFKIISDLNNGDTVSFHTHHRHTDVEFLEPWPESYWLFKKKDSYWLTCSAAQTKFKFKTVRLTDDQILFFKRFENAKQDKNTWDRYEFRFSKTDTTIKAIRHLAYADTLTSFYIKKSKK